MIRSRVAHPVYDLGALLAAGNGTVSGELVDAGMVRPYSGTYRFYESGDALVLSPATRAAGRQAVMPRLIPLTPELLGFLGMYSGDGNKTGSIGFAQRNVLLLEAACRGMRLLFGDSALFTVNLLNDSRYFMRPEFAPLLASAGIDASVLPTMPARAVPSALRDQLKSEFLQEVRGYPILQSITSISTTVSPLKGAREAGGESREYIVSLLDSRWLLPIVLQLIAHLNESLTANVQTVSVGGRTVLDWGDSPLRAYYFEIDARDYIDRHPGCQWYTSSGRSTRYACQDVDGRLRVGGAAPFGVPARIELGPVTSYAAGLYLAEGTSDKDALLGFDSPDMPGAGLALSFNSSENTSLALFLASLVECLGGVSDAVQSWKVKVGSQYMYEMQVLGELYQAPMVRKGAKGQGLSRSCVQAGFARDWAMEQFPALAEARDLFSHIEYTGAGIVRVQVTCGSAPARLLFSLYRTAIGALIPNRAPRGAA